MVTRQIKEEMLQAVAPELYAPLTVPKLESKRRGGAGGSESKGKKHQQRRKRRDAADGSSDDEGQETVARRGALWKGRRVRRALRPGTVVHYTPGRRTYWRGFKRSYDEVQTDEDILKQAQDWSDEFRYGKRRADDLMMAIPLDESNPTPSLKAVTPQQVLPVEPQQQQRRKRSEELQPTMQLMVAKRRKMDSVLDSAYIDPAEEPEVTVRPIKQVAPGLGVQTVDVQIPLRRSPAGAVPMVVEPAASVDAAVGPDAPMADPADVAAASRAAAVTAATVATQTDPWVFAPRGASRVRRARRAYGPASAVMPQYALHPSIIPTPGYRGAVFVRRGRRRPASRRRAATATRRVGRRRRVSRRQTRSLLPPGAVTRVVRRTPGEALVLPRVRYHPSITATQAP